MPSQSFVTRLVQAIILMPSSVWGHLTHRSHQRNSVVTSAPKGKRKKKKKRVRKPNCSFIGSRTTPSVQLLKDTTPPLHTTTHTFIPPQAQWHTDIFCSCGCLLLLSCKALLDFPPTSLSLTKILFLFFKKCSLPPQSGIFLIKHVPQPSYFLSW